MSHPHHCDKCDADYAYDTTHVCDYGDRIEELEARIAELEAAPRLVLAYQAVVDVDPSSFYDGRSRRPRVVGTYLDKDRAAQEAEAEAVKIRRERGCCNPGGVRPRSYPVIVVTSAAGRGNLVQLGDVVDLVE